MKYIQNGGQIQSADDLDKIHCLNEAEKEMLKAQLQFNRVEKASQEQNRNFVSSSLIIELNTADTEQLMKLPGIGKWFARKIIERREQLGGFYDEQQLLEVYRMTQGKIDTLYDHVRINKEMIRRIPINDIHPDSLALHPYFRRKLAQTICSYRDKHGRYRDMHALTQAIRLDSLELQKISYYLQFN